MEIKFDVKMTPNILYGFLLHHTYNSFSGILGTAVGAFLLFAYFKSGYLLYLAGGVLLLLYMPVVLRIKASKQVLLTPAFKKPLSYCLSDDGVQVSQDEVTETLPWDGFIRAESTSGALLLYSTKVNACIFPRKALGDKAPQVIAMISSHMEPKKVKIRW